MNEKSFMNKEEYDTHPVSIHTEKCVGCRSCQLACSFENLREYNPLISHIVLIRNHGVWTTDINFTEDCTLCGSCAFFCSHGALTLK